VNGKIWQTLMSDLRNSRMMGGTRLTIQFRICWIALGIDRFDAISGLI
jgi:hypothetical protein